MISGVFCTARRDPKFQYLADSLAISLSNCAHPFELLVIDKLLWDSDPYKCAERRKELYSAVNGRFSFRHVTPKPSVWQGPYRKTKRDWYALNNARNTGLALARGSHIILMDDCTVFDEDWYSWHYRGAVQGIAVAGSFRSYTSAKVEDGRVVSGVFHPAGETDHRGEQIREAPGGWLYGLNMSFPLKAALAINGFDELYDGQGGSEDVDFGVRLERFGCKVFFMPGCVIHQSLETHEPVCEFTAWGEPQRVPQKEKLLKDGKMHFANEFLIQELLETSGRVLPRGNDFDLKELRKEVLLTGIFPTRRAATNDWRDGAPLESM